MMFTAPNGIIMPVDGGVLSHPTPPSPAISSISSYGSGTVLIHGHQPKAGIKRKSTPLTIGRKHAPHRITTIIWSGLFLVVIVATVIVVAALAENIKKLLWTRVSFREDGVVFQPIGSPIDDSYPKILPEKERSCTYRRIIWERGSQHSEIIHDLSSKWSAVVDYDQERCLVFYLPNSQIEGCPKSYPWDLDLQVGVPSCRGPLARIAPIRKIMHHMCNTAVNLTATGDAISTACLEYRIMHVDRVIIQYYDRQLRRVARSPTAPKLPSMASPKIPTPHEASNDDASKKHSQESMELLNKPIQSTKSAINSETQNTFSTIVEVKKPSEPSTWDSASNVNGIGSPTTNSPIATSEIMTTPVSSSETLKIRIQNDVNNVSKSKLINVLLNDAKEKPKNEDVPPVIEPVVESYWEAVSNSVDPVHNQILKAHTLKKLMEMSMGKTNVGPEPTVIE